MDNSLLLTLYAQFFHQLKAVNWAIILQVIYVLLVIVVGIRIVFDTRSIPKTLAYLMLVVFVPILGIIFYFSFGINYRKRKMYDTKLKIDKNLRKRYSSRIEQLQKEISIRHNSALQHNLELVRMLSNKRMGAEAILPNYELKLLYNGEEFFPVLKDALRKAQSHIHIEFYIFENDGIGNEIKDILIDKAKSGVEVRFIYDDFGSMGIRRSFVNSLTSQGVQAFPFHKIRFIKLANRLNYRNHRKIVVVDGELAFVGGINISDRYNNDCPNEIYWRDTHLMIKGYSAQALQQVFLSDWNHCSTEDLTISEKYFPELEIPAKAQKHVQIVSSGPDSDLPYILYSFIQAINLAEQEILITTPYYIPDISIQEMLRISALSGLNVRLLVPYVGDSKLVSIAAQSFYEELLEAGVRIFLYKKGFIHAKTFVTDRKLASVGTANFDSRSFDLNFEVAAMIYDTELAEELARKFYEDLEDAEELTLAEWRKRPKWLQLVERIVRLASPFL